MEREEREEEAVQRGAVHSREELHAEDVEGRLPALLVGPQGLPELARDFLRGDSRTAGGGPGSAAAFPGSHMRSAGRGYGYAPDSAAASVGYGRTPMDDITPCGGPRMMVRPSKPMRNV